MRLHCTHVLALISLHACLAHEEACEEAESVLLLQDRLSLAPYDTFKGTGVESLGVRRTHGPGHSQLLQLQVMQEAAKKRELDAQALRASQMLAASKHTTGLLICAVILGIVLIFWLCMASSLGRSSGEAAHLRRLTASDWLMALMLGTALLGLQLYAFFHIGLLSPPADDYAFPLMVGCAAVTFFGPVLVVSCLHCHSSFSNLDEELVQVTKRFDRLERLVSAGFHKNLEEEKELLQSLRK